MSSTAIKALWPGEKTEDLMELRNSHGSAPIVWSAMCVRYLNQSSSSWLFNSDKLWPLARNSSVPEVHRMVLAMTYDNVCILKKDYARAAKDIRQFLLDFSKENEGGVNHWPAIAAMFESDPDCPAIGFHWTSVNSDPWEGPWDEEKDEPGQFDWSQAWSLYDSFSKPAA